MRSLQPTGYRLGLVPKLRVPSSGAHRCEWRHSGTDRGANRDSRGAHGQKEDRNATVLGRIRIGPGQKQHPVGSMGSARPDILTADDKVVAIFNRVSGQPGEVGAGVRLREALTPALKSRVSLGAGAHVNGKDAHVVVRRGPRSGARVLSAECLVLSADLSTPACAGRRRASLPADPHPALSHCGGRGCFRARGRAR